MRLNRSLPIRSVNTTGNMYFRDPCTKYFFSNMSANISFPSKIKLIITYSYLPVQSFQDNEQ